MSAAQHTPGPWVIEKIGPDDWQVNSDLRDYCLFDVTPRIGLKHLTKEDKANARLISAAPDLLEVLSEIVEMIDPAGHDVNFEAARAAIAKATGAAA